MTRLLTVLLVVGSVSALAQPRTRGHKDVKPEAPPERVLLRPARLDFEGSKLTGQLNTAGGVYLYDRKQLTPRSMIHTPESFRAEIITEAP